MTATRPRAGELTLRPWTRADREDWLALFSDPEVLRWVGDARVARGRDTAIFERLMALPLGPEQRFAYV
ncbi:MAG TPA: GNAT family N-acetyltransferase [Myxococcota bacterium]|nr:GNAT family N-acetyltransferase [Myxococcota bacterium]